MYLFFEGFSKALTKGICHKSCKGLGCLGLSLSKMIYFYFVVLYCNYLPQHCHSISSIKNDIPSDCAVLFVPHKLFVILFRCALEKTWPAGLESLCCSVRLTLGGAVPLCVSVRMRRLHSNPAGVESEEGNASQLA